MHPTIYQEFETICRKRSSDGAVLEIGAVPSVDSLLNMKSLRGASPKIGVNLDGPYEFKDFVIEKGNGNLLHFEDNTFDTVLCNATLEHDKFFWKTIDEIKRVAKPGGLVVIGTPGFMHYRFENVRYYVNKIGFIRRLIAKSSLFNLFTSTVTLQVHNAPGDYYRFSQQAYEEIFFEGLREVEIKSIMVPPRIIGVGVLPDDELPYQELQKEHWVPESESVQ